MSGDRGKLIQQHGWVVTGTLVTESTYIMIRQCWVTVRVRVRAFVCVYSFTPRHTQCCGRGHAARNLHSTYYIYFTHTQLSLSQNERRRVSARTRARERGGERERETFMWWAGRGFRAFRVITFQMMLV